jgi:hypothetical protein
MFEVGKDYRIFLQRGGNLAKIEGTLLETAGDVLKLEVEGVQTIFHLRGGFVVYVEVIDEKAEAAQGDRLVSSFR